MAGQTTTGKAFEYAVLKAILSYIPHQKFVDIIEDAHYKSAQKKFESLELAEQNKYELAAKPAAKMLVLLEPSITNKLSSLDKVQFAIQSDQKGKKGDPRDILISRAATNWQIGISAKHGHEAVKHSRLSMKLDFGTDWLGYPCSPQYFQEIKPIFDGLDELKSQECLWKEVPNKAVDIYVPVLNAFKKELLRLNQSFPDVARNLVSYLIGIKDFYKIMMLGPITSVQVLNLHGTLSKSLHNIKSPVKLQRLELPNRIIELDFSDTSETTTLILVCDEGWQMKFRIHSAETEVIPSLKFDVGLIAKPNDLRTFDFLWEVTSIMV